MHTRYSESDARADPNVPPTYKQQAIILVSSLKKKEVFFTLLFSSTSAVAQADTQPTMEGTSPSPFDAFDAIISDDVDHQLSTFLNTNDDPRDATERLMESYEGVPDMIRALVEWSDIYADGTANLEQAVETVLLEHEQTIIPRLDEALATTEKSLPVVTTVTESKRWNPVVCSMAARNKESTLHNLLIRESRLSQAGINQEVLQTPASFVDAITEQFTKLFSADKQVSDDELLGLYNRVSALCTYDECSTIVSLRMFNKLSHDADTPFMRGLYRRVGQEVRKEAVRVMTAANIMSEHMARQYVIRLAFITDCVESNVSMRKPIVDALLNLFGGTDRSIRRRFETETKILRGVYGCLIGDIEIKEADSDVVETVQEFQGSVADKVVLIRMLCHVEVFEDILKALFSHKYRTYLDGEPDISKRTCLCMLLAYAGVFICKDDKELPTMLEDEVAKEKLRNEMKTTFTEIRRVAEVCESLKPGCPRFKIRGPPVQVLLEGTKSPLIARGVLMWAKEGLEGGSNLRELLVTAPTHLAFLEAIAEKHPVLQGEVLEVIREAFMRDYPELDVIEVEKLRDKFTKTITGLVRIQMAPQIVRMFQGSWANNKRVDLAHLRHFINGLLQIISPPFSRTFAASVMELLNNERVASAIQRDPVIVKKALTFRKEAEKMGLT